MSASDFESITGGVANLVTAAALIIGGIWAVFTFGSLLKIPKERASLQLMEHQIRQGELERLRAEADIRKSDAELRQLDLENRTQAVVDMSIDANSVTVPGETRVFLAVTVTVTNTGNQNTRLILRDQRPFSIRRVSFGTDGAANYGDRRDFAVARAAMPDSWARSIVVRTGGTERIPFLVAVPEPGLYHLAFSIPLAPADAAVSEEAGTELPPHWAAQKYVVVGEDECPAPAVA